MQANYTINELKTKYLDKNIEIPQKILKEMKSDKRVGVQKILKIIEQRNIKYKKEIERLNKISKFEYEYWEKGYQFIAGIDEVGCAPLAGPVLAAAVILPKDCKIEGVNDSKMLSKRMREKLADEIKEKAITWATGQASPKEIAKLNIYYADLLAMKRAVDNLKINPDFLLIDGRSLPQVKIEQLKIIQGDKKSISIACASIIAKVARDTLMSEYDKIYPGYFFSKNQGYATLAHIKALEELGMTPIHRQSWNAVKKYSFGKFNLRYKDK